jgi:hypothetical protein
MRDRSDTSGMSEEEGFRAMALFLDAYWRRGGGTSDDLAVLLGSLEVDPAQRDDWTDAVRRASANIR